uniref:NADH-ubiquinone oxidoreductase chain 2 n=1 Tax=Sivaloka damnosus TaxID=568780 RepID=D8KZG2_SIVDA|nr:NADH dehydrogenase subunit 2 [Sivaloka damnosus]
MKMNLTKMMMITTMMLSTLMTVSSNSLLISWMSLEINTMTFIPLMTKSKKMSDQTMKYFIIQSISSSLMFMSIMMNSMIETPLEESMLFMVSMLMKMGIMPFHLWMPSLMKAMSWMNCMIMTTMQKISPTIMITQVMSIKMILPFMILSLIMGPMSNLNQTSTKKIMAFSSISNSSWMIMSNYISKFQFSMFVFIYSTLNILTMNILKKMNSTFINQMMTKSNFYKLNLSTNLFSMSGMPPFLGFIPKWIILQSSIQVSMTMLISMILSSMISTYIYLSMMKPMMMNMISSLKNKKEKKKNFLDISINLVGTPMMIVLKTN